MEYGTAPESAATADAWLSDHVSSDGEQAHFPLFIDGKFMTGNGFCLAADLVNHHIATADALESRERTRRERRPTVIHDGHRR